MAGVEDLRNESSVEFLVGVANVFGLDENVRPEQLGVADGVCGPLDGFLLSDRAAHRRVQAVEHYTEYFRVLYFLRACMLINSSPENKHAKKH